MGIMDVLESLSGPEYDEPAPLEAVQPGPAAPEAAAPPVVIDTEAVPPAVPVPEESPGKTEPVRESAEETTLLSEETCPAPEKRISLLRRRLRLRPEMFLGILAVLAMAVLIAVVVLCYPYFRTDEDPESVRHPIRQVDEDPFLVTERPEEEFLEPTVSETEPENPTIPPDRNPYDRYDFQYNRNNYLVLQNVKSYPGVDVSAYQGVIDWEKVKASGIDFAMIRLGYRGYESGKLVEDKYARDNLEGARTAGLRVGAYFFSQALSIRETDQEIDFMLEILGETPLDMPIVLDWEIPASNARTKNMDARTLTDIQRHFCGQMRDRGYQPMIYFNWHQSENLYYLSDLEEYPFWLAMYQDRMTYPWKVEMWQWTQTGRVPGISGDVDINVYMPH